MSPRSGDSVTLCGRIRSFGPALLLIFLCVLSSYGQKTNNTSARAAKEDDIREAVLRYQMFSWSSEADKSEANAKDDNEKSVAKHLNSRVYLLSVNSKDPTDEFLKRFQDAPRTTKKASEGKQTKKFPGWVVDRKTKHPGILFSANEIRWLSENDVEVDGGYHCGGLCGAGEVFTVRFDDGKWKVIQAVTKWIS